MASASASRQGRGGVSPAATQARVESTDHFTDQCRQVRHVGENVVDGIELILETSR